MSPLELKKHGVKVFLLTNAMSSHAEGLMRFAFGEDWTGLFDLLVYSANKSRFFQLENKMKLVQVEEKVFQGGSFEDMKQYLPGDKVLYIGDHMEQDVVAPHSIGWSTLAIIENCDDMRLNPLFSDNTHPCKLLSFVKANALSYSPSVSTLSYSLLHGNARSYSCYSTP